MHVIEELSFPVLGFVHDLWAPCGWIDNVPVPVMSVGSDIFTEISKLVLGVQDVAGLNDVNNDWVLN